MCATAKRGTEPASRGSLATFFAEWIPVVATGAAFFMIVLDASVVNLALAHIGTELNSGLTILQWLIDGYALVFASMLLGAGALGDRFGVKSSLMCGLLVFTVASALCGIAPSMEALQISRVVQGIGAALLLPNSLAALNHTFVDPLRRSRAVAAWASAGGKSGEFGSLSRPVILRYWSRNSSSLWSHGKFFPFVAFLFKPKQKPFPGRIIIR